MFILIALFASTLSAQSPTAPVVSPRGVINAFTNQPAPTTVGAGGLIYINGLNLGPVEGFIVQDVPWPTQFGTPAIQVLINNRPAPLYSASPSRILAQVPYETQNGQAQLVVKRGDLTSQPVRFIVQATAPSVKTIDESGFGAADVTTNGNTVLLRAMGVGLATPVVPTGAVGPRENPAVARAAVRAIVGGRNATVTATASADRVGEFDIAVGLPGDAKPGDVITLQFGNAIANRTLYQRIQQAVTTFLPFPDGTPTFTGFASSDLRPGYIGLSAAVGSDGCYPSYIADVQNAKLSKVDACLIAANRAQASPFTTATEGDSMAALVGPAEGTAPAGISKKLVIFNPTKADAMNVDLPVAVATLGANGTGDFLAVVVGQAGVAAQVVNADTGEIQPLAGGAVGGAGGGGNPGGGGFGGLFVPPSIDLGDGLKHILSNGVNFGPGLTGYLVADDATKPTKAKLAVVNAQIVVQATRDFPEDYVPLISPQQAAVGGPGGIIGIPGIGGGGLFAAARTLTFMDATTRLLYVLSAKPDNSIHGFVSFPIVDAPSKVYALPEKTFFAACNPQMQIYSLELSRTIAVAVGNNAAVAVRNPCNALGFATLNLTTPAISVLNMPGTGSFNASGATVNDLNDHIYAANSDPASQNRSDTLYAFDGVTNSALRFDLPPEVPSFSNLTPIPQMSAIVGQATKTAVGDVGLVLFDLELASARLLPTPTGYTSVQVVSIFPATRKLLARGVKTNPASTEFLIYDLVSGDLTIIPNPAGVSFVGVLPAVPGVPGAGGGQQQQQPLQRTNAKSNVVEAVTFSSDRRQTGVMLIQIH